MKISLISIGLLLLILLDSIELRMTDERLYNKLKRFSGRIEVGYYTRQNTRIRYVDAGDPDNQTIIFLHGAPGTLDAFMLFLRDSLLLRHFRMIAVDRPGFGYSERGKPFPSIQQQANLLLPLLNKSLNSHKPILVGHSYGGPIAAAMALEAPGKVGGIMLIGAAMDPEQERVFWISYLIDLPWIEPFLPSSLYVTNVEKLAHKEELNDLKPEWNKIDVPLTIIHGGNDLIVPVENAGFSQRMFVNADVELIIRENAGHFIPWLQPELIKKELLKMKE